MTTKSPAKKSPAKKSAKKSVPKIKAKAKPKTKTKTSIKKPAKKLPGKIAKKNGRPLLFQTPEELEEKIDEYFKSCWSTDKKGMKHQIRPYTMTGLAVGLGTNRRALLNYKYREKFLPTIKKALAVCENYAEERLYSNSQVAGPIFCLKNNYGWKDQTEQNVKTEKTTINFNIGVEVSDLCGEILVKSNIKNIEHKKTDDEQSPGIIDIR